MINHLESSLAVSGEILRMIGEILRMIAVLHMLLQGYVMSSDRTCHTEFATQKGNYLCNVRTSDLHLSVLFSLSIT